MQSHTEQPESSKKSWSLMVLYILGTGVFGGHRFYAGRPFSGTAQLLVSIFPFSIMPLLATVGFKGCGVPIIGAGFIITAFAWYVLDLLLLFSGFFRDQDLQRIRPKPGELAWLWQSLLWGVVFFCVQALIACVWLGGVSQLVKVLLHTWTENPPNLVMWALCTWTSSFIALYVWREWFMVRAIGAIFIVQVVLLNLYVLFFAGKESSFFFMLLTRRSSLEFVGSSIYGHYVATIQAFLSFTGFVLLNGLWFLAGMAAVFVRKTDLYKHQGKLGGVVSLVFLVSLVVWGQLTSLFGWVVFAVLGIATLASLAPPFRQEMREDAYNHGQVRPVVSFSLLACMAAALGLALDVLAGALRYTHKVHLLRSKHPTLSPDAESLQVHLIDWRMVWIAVFCMALVLGYLLWLHRRQLGPAFAEARLTIIALVMGGAMISFSIHQYLEGELSQAFRHINSDHGKLFGKYQHAALSPSLQQTMGIHDTARLTSLLSLARHYFGPKRPANRIWISPKGAFVLNIFNRPIYPKGADRDKPPPRLSASGLLKLYKSKVVFLYTLKGYSGSRKHLVDPPDLLRIVVAPNTPMTSLCKYMRAFAKSGYTRLQLQTPRFRAIQLQNKSISSVVSWYNHRLVWGQERYVRSKKKAIDVLYNDKLAKALEAGEWTLRLCHR